MTACKDQSNFLEFYFPHTTVTVALVPQLPHFEATSSAGGLVMDHWALSMI